MTQRVGGPTSREQALSGGQRPFQHGQGGELGGLSQVQAHEMADGGLNHVRNTPSGGSANRLSPPPPKAPSPRGGLRSAHQQANATANTRSSCCPPARPRTSRGPP